MILTAEFDASPERVWELWADPRQLERWWGPPTWPATFTRHDLAPGSHVEYHMTGPTGDEAHGFWDIVEVDPPHRLVFVDGFAQQRRHAERASRATRARVTIEPIGAGRTRMSIESHFPSTEAMEQVLGDGHGGGPDRRRSARSTRSSPRMPSTTRRCTMTTMTEPTTHTLDVPGRRPDLRRPARDDGSDARCCC